MDTADQRMGLAVTARTLSIPPDVKQIKRLVEPVYTSLLITCHTYRKAVTLTEPNVAADPLAFSVVV